MVEKHSQRVPELVGRLRACHRDDGSQAGEAREGRGWGEGGGAACAYMIPYH